MCCWAGATDAGVAAFAAALQRTEDADVSPNTRLDKLAAACETYLASPPAIAAPANAPWRSPVATGSGGGGSAVRGPTLRRGSKPAPPPPDDAAAASAASTTPYAYEPSRYPTITALNLSECVGVGDGAVKAIAQYLGKLQDLSVHGCLKITDDGLMHLARPRSSLRRLNHAGCYKITDGGVRYICDKVRSLSLYNNPNQFSFSVPTVKDGGTTTGRKKGRKRLVM